jgi:hypothetical protein
MNSQEYLDRDFTEEIENNLVELELLTLNPVKVNMAIDVGTSETRALPFNAGSDTINPSDIIMIPNKFAKLNPSDLKDLRRLEYEESTFSNMMCMTMTNINNSSCPLFNKPTTISKGLLSDKLVKNSGYSVSNTAKYLQVEEYIINTYSAVITQMYTNMVFYLSKGDIENAKKSLNVELNLAFMLPDEEKLEPMAASLVNALQGTIEFELPTYHDLKGRFTIRNNAPNQWLDLYGEAESVIYYFLVKNPDPKYLKAFKNHGVAVTDVGEGSIDDVFFKERELMARASSTSRDVNGLTLINRTIKNIRESALKRGQFIKPTVESIKKVLKDPKGDLILETPMGEYDISEDLTRAKEEIASEIANIFKNDFEQNTVLTLDRLFLVILAGRTMTSNPKSPSLGTFIAQRLSEQLMIPKDVVKITHPDSNLIGCALKLIMKMKKFNSMKPSL